MRDDIAIHHVPNYCYSYFALLPLCVGWLDQCCRPITDDLWHFCYSSVYVVATMVHKMETSHPEAVATMLKLSADLFPIDADGTGRLTRTGGVFYNPTPPPGLTRAHHSHFSCFPSAAAGALAGLHAYMLLSAPFSRELPFSVLDAIAADPSGALAETCKFTASIALSLPKQKVQHLTFVTVADRRHTRVVMVPIVRRIFETLLAHATVIEWPSIEWSKEKFPFGGLGSGTWDALPPSFFAINWVVCERHHLQSLCIIHLFC
eukprot:SAG31_NODE_474_length_15176_cov_7.362340_5_plen_262_part_00